MTERRTHSIDRVERLLRRLDDVDYSGTTMSDASPMAGGLSSTMTKVTVEGAGRSVAFVLRSAKGDDADRRSLSIADEYHLIEALHRLGTPVARPRLLDEKPEERPDDNDVAVYDFVEGAPRITNDDPTQVGERYAETLLRIHATDTTSLPLLPDRASAVGTMLADQPAMMDDSLDEPTIRSTLEDHWPPPPTERRLLHGDYFPGNVLWRGDEIVAVIDWEDAALGDPLADVATTRLDLLWVHGPEATEAFTSTYLDATSLDTTGLAVWDLVAALRPAGYLSLWAADWADLGRPDITPTMMRATHQGFVVQAMDQLNRASRRTP